MVSFPAVPHPNSSFWRFWSGFLFPQRLIVSSCVWACTSRWLSWPLEEQIKSAWGQHAHASCNIYGSTNGITLENTLAVFWSLCKQGLNGLYGLGPGFFDPQPMWFTNQKPGDAAEGPIRNDALDVALDERQRFFWCLPAPKTIERCVSQKTFLWAASKPSLMLLGALGITLTLTSTACLLSLLMLKALTAGGFGWTKKSNRPKLPVKPVESQFLSKHRSCFFILPPKRTSKTTPQNNTLSYKIL